MTVAPIALVAALQDAGLENEANLKLAVRLAQSAQAAISASSDCLVLGSHPDLNDGSNP